MPTVTEAVEGLSSCSQNAAYSPTIMAAQIRSAKAQAENGNPAMVTVRRTSYARVMTSCGYWVRLARITFHGQLIGREQECGLKGPIEAKSNLGHTLVAELPEQG